MSVKGKVKRANKRIAELECLLKQEIEAMRLVKIDFNKKFNDTVEQVKIKDNILKQLVMRECGSLKGGINLMVDSSINDLEIIIDKNNLIGEPECYRLNQECYTIRIHPKWR